MKKSRESLINYIENRKMYSDDEIQNRKIMTKKQIDKAKGAAKALQNYRYKGVKSIVMSSLSALVIGLIQFGNQHKPSEPVVNLMTVWIGIMIADIALEAVLLIIHTIDIRALEEAGVTLDEIEQAVRLSDKII